jgi:tetratricopeptide (TPR) repeat protein
MRDYNGFFQTRRRILFDSKQSSRGLWLAYAVACHLKNDFLAAFEVIDKYFESLSDLVDPYEDSELLLFQCKQLELCGKFEEALVYLEKMAERIVDNHSYKIQKAVLYLYSEDWTVSLPLWSELLRAEPENFFFHIGMQASMLNLPLSQSMQFLKSNSLPVFTVQCPSEVRSSLLQFYSQLESKTFQKIRLVLLRDEPNHNELLKKFIVSSLEKGYPSLSEDLVFLATSSTRSIHQCGTPVVFQNNEIVQASLSVVDEVLSSGTFDALTHLWAFFLKSHLLMVSGSFLEALDILDRGISHTPTAIDFYVKKAEVLLLVGQIDQAVATIEECRCLDLQDRYLNNYSTKFFLKSDKIPTAQETIAVFTKHDGDSEKTLIDLQCSWYELETAESYARQKCWTEAIVKYNSVREHFKDQYNDMFDFHSYCVRKVLKLL